MRLHPMLLVAVLLIGMGVMAGPAAGQDATPPANPGPSGPVAPGDCAAEPLSTDELFEIWFRGATPIAGLGLAATPAASPTPFVLPPLEPVDAETMVAVGLAARELVACFLAGDPTRAFALFTDDLVRLYGPGVPMDREAIPDFLRTRTLPVMRGGPEGAYLLVDTGRLPDGRMAAHVVSRHSGPDQFALFVVFERTGNRWLADEVIDLMGGAPPEATPAP